MEWHGTTFLFYDSSFHPEDIIKTEQYPPSRFLLAVCTVLSSSLILTRNNEFEDTFYVFTKFTFLKMYPGEIELHM